MRRNKNVLVIGLTGTIASGKSTVSRYLGRRYGAIHIDADLVAREVVESMAKELSGVFGEEILKEDGTIDRKALGAIVFSDQEALSELNRLVHPRTCENIAAQIETIGEEASEEKTDIVVVEAIELIRSGLRDVVDTIWVVYADPEVRIKRLMSERLLSEEEASDRLASQWDDETYRSYADTVIHSTDGDVGMLFRQVDRAMEKIL